MAKFIVVNHYTQQRTIRVSVDKICFYMGQLGGEYGNATSICMGSDSDILAFESPEEIDALIAAAKKEGA